MAYAECTILHNSWLTRGAELAYVLMYQVFSKKQELYGTAPVFCSLFKFKSSEKFRQVEVWRGVMYRVPRQEMGLGKIVATFIYIGFRLYTVPAVEFVHE